LKNLNPQQYRVSDCIESAANNPQLAKEPERSPNGGQPASPSAQAPSIADPLNSDPPQPNSDRTTHIHVILAVDDTPSNLQVLFVGLEKAGFKVLVAQNAVNALQIAESQVPDLILLDILMPGLDGFETCRQLKANPTTRKIPVIFLTALSETTNKVRGLELGGVDYVTKPIDRDELLARIRTHLTLQTIQQRLTTQNQELQREIQTRKHIELQLQDRQQQLQKAIDFKASVERITEQIRDSLDEHQILRTVTEELGKVLSATSCQIELYDKEFATATIAYEYSSMLPQCEGMIRQIANFPKLYEQLLQKHPLQFVNYTPEFSPKPISSTYFACPIVEPQDDRGTIGNLWLLRPKEEIFEPSEMQLVQQIASQCAIAIRQARLYEAAQQQVRELEKLNQLKDDFLKTISHELRAPMSSIQLAARTLEKLLNIEVEAQKSPTLARILKIFHQSCDRQKQLVDDLLSLCYLEAKAETIVFEWIDLQNWLPEILELFLDRAQAQQLALNLELDPTLPLLKADVSILERILTELLNNACKYTPAGETIVVSAQSMTTHICVSVRNSGVEIAPEEQQRIFEQFYRIPNNDPWQHGGTGLGLTLVKKLAQLLEVAISVESANGYTEFSAIFPLTNC
jgi:signal transduction histidine kinase/DNA-binding response OmpR family regulator